jgi:hypothetical protein
MRNQPLDINPNLRSGSVRLARILSDIFSPPSSLAIFAFILAWVELPFWQGLLQGAIFGACSSLLPILYILLQMKLGKIEDIHISAQNQRHIPYLIGILGALLAYGLLRWMDGSPVLLNLAIANAIVLALTALLNLRFLISAHTTGISLVAAFSALVYDWWLWLALVPLIILVVVMRKYLRRHTYAELLAGFIVGTLTAVSLALFGAFTP